MSVLSYIYDAWAQMYRVVDNQNRNDKKQICFNIYSKTSLERPFTGVNSSGPFREVVDLQNFPNTEKIRYFYFGFVKSRSI